MECQCLGSHIPSFRLGMEWGCLAKEGRWEHELWFMLCKPQHLVQEQVGGGGPLSFAMKRVGASRGPGSDMRSFPMEVE